MKTVVIVGVGALGSHVVQFLRNEEAAIRVIDFDRVEQKNVASQFHGKPSVGKSKVQSLQQTMHMLYGEKIQGIPHRLTQDNVKQLLGDADLVIDCLDNGASRRIVQLFVSASRDSLVPCLHGCLDGAGSFGRVIWDEDFVIDDESEGGAATCEDGEHLPFIAIVSAYVAQAAKVFLRTGKKRGFSVNPAGVLST